MTTEADQDNPDYRAAVLLGRRQALTEVMQHLTSPHAMPAEASFAAIAEWCAQTEQEIDDELHLIISAQGAKGA